MHYSIRTEQSYVQWIRRHILFHNKMHPKDMGEKEINAFLKHLAVNRNVTASTQTQALSALLFLYKKVLGYDIGFKETYYVFSRFNNCPNFFNRSSSVECRKYWAKIRQYIMQ